jgi:2-amino-4-hydroxy-6-hydroxymethyldihydropteridine diphosphokinase
VRVVFAIVAIGSNLAGNFPSPAAAAAAAMTALDSGEIRITARSRFYRSTAWPDPSDPEFVNAAVLVETSLSAAALLARLHQIEAAFGRERKQINAPRTLDLDIVDYGGTVTTADDTPVLPHPRLADRAFVLLPLVDVAPDWRHPATGATAAALVAALPRPLGVEPL